jgi:hypothetical protein
MKSLSVLAAVCLFSSLLPAQTTTSFHSEAEAASVLTRVNNAQIMIDLDRQTTSTLLDYFASTQNVDGSVTQTFGIGSIPNDDFLAAGTQHMSLNVDTSQVAGFRTTQCTFSFTPFFTSTCSQGTLGVIQVKWVNNGITTSSVLSEDHRTIGGSVTIDSHVNANESSADVSGSFLGQSFSSSVFATVGINKDTTITVTQ